MVMVRFSKEWEEKLGSGQKTQTIRPMQSYRHLAVGDRIDCWITERRVGVNRPIPSRKAAIGIVTEIIEEVPFFTLFQDTIAKADGFHDWKEMYDWFMAHYNKNALYNQKFKIIRWEKK